MHQAITLVTPRNNSRSRALAIPDRSPRRRRAFKLPSPGEIKFWAEPNLLLVHVHDRRGREAVEVGRGGVAVGADVLAEDEVVALKLGQILRHRDHIERVAGRAEDGTEVRRPLLERLDRILAVIKDDAGIGVIDAVVDVIAGFAVAHGLADDLRHRVPRAGHEKTARLGENLDVLGAVSYTHLRA